MTRIQRKLEHAARRRELTKQEEEAKIEAELDKKEASFIATMLSGLTVKNHDTCTHNGIAIALRQWGTPTCNRIALEIESMIPNQD